MLNIRRKQIKIQQSRADVINELIKVMTEATKDTDCEPIEVLSACMSMTQNAVAFVVNRSPDHETRILNQRTVLSALDVLKLAAVEADSKLSVQ
jgi:hypothetical protein